MLLTLSGLVRFELSGSETDADVIVFCGGVVHFMAETAKDY